VAGVDPETLSHVRPVTSAAAPLTRRLLRPEGLFEIGALVELGNVTPLRESSGKRGPPFFSCSRELHRDARPGRVSRAPGGHEFPESRGRLWRGTRASLEVEVRGTGW